MLQLMIIIAFLLIICGFLFNKSKLIYICTILYMFSLFAFNTNNADYINYVKKFSYANEVVVRNADNEIGFDFISKIIGYLGGTYQTLLFFIALIGLIYIGKIVIKLTNRSAYVLILYFLFPFFLDIVQVRFFIATVIFLYSSTFLYKPGFTNDICYIICIIIASTFHYAALLLLPLVFAKYFSTNILLAGTVLVTLFGSLMSYGNMAYSILQRLMPSQKAAEWFKSNTNWGWILYLVLHIIILFFVFYSVKIYIYNTSHNKTNIIITHYMEMVLKINIILLYLVIFYAYGVTFFRIYRAIFLLNYICFGITLNSYGVKCKKYYLYFLLTLILALFFSCYMILPGMERTLIPIFTNNCLWYR